MKKKTVGIIGFGSFGKFLAEKLSPIAKIKVYSSSGRPSKWKASLDEVVKADYLIPAIPLDAYDSMLNSIKHMIGKRTVIIDVCSVKEEPMRLIKSILPGQLAVATHPLFGPESAGRSMAGHTLVLCPENSDKTELKKIEDLAVKLKLKVVKLSVTQHDKEMALIQGLTFFIAHSLKDLKLHEQHLSTPSFEKLLQLANLEKHHSYELFRTIQAGNTKTKAIRKKFIKLAQDLDHNINQI